MTKLLFIQASPRGAQSKSVQLGLAYIDALRASRPDIDVDTIQLWQADLPAFDGDRVAAKMNIITGQEHSASQQTAWSRVVEIANRFIAADHYVFAVPMWNGGIAYPLKHYIDIIHQPGLLFGLTPEEGYVGLLKNKKATLVLTSGAYAQHFPSPQFGVDHQSTYLRAWLNQAGITDIDEIRFQPTLLTQDPEGDYVAARQRAVDLARAHTNN